MQTKRIAVSVVALSVLSCAHANPSTRRVDAAGRGVIVTGGTCPSQRPPSWPKSQFRLRSGAYEGSLDSQTGALVFNVAVDSIPGPQAAQVSLWNATFRRDSSFARSPIKMRAPVGRYSFRVRKLGAQTLQDSVDVRSKYVDTLSVVLGREVVCLQ